MLSNPPKTLILTIKRIYKLYKYCYSTATRKREVSGYFPI
uniref:Uncharacterized protein n=1 Tax=Anguilla anguilla TaxID=7936 RepID=A0A0E9S890_ANGAN